MKKALPLVLGSILLGSNAHALELSGRITDPHTDRVTMSIYLVATNKIPFCAKANFYFRGDAIRWEAKVKVLNIESPLDANRRYSFDAREAIQEATSGVAALCEYRLQHVCLNLFGRYGGEYDSYRHIWLQPEAHRDRSRSFPVPLHHDSSFYAHRMDFGLDSSIEVNLTPSVPRQR